MKAKLLIAFFLLLFSAAVFATPSPAVTVTGIDCAYTRDCAEFRWDAAASADFNNFIFSITSNDTTNTEPDVNLTGNSASLCGIGPDYWTKGTVTRYDGNADGKFTNMLEEACVVNPGGIMRGGQYAVYNMLVWVGALIGMMILVVVGAWVVSHFVDFFFK